MPLEDETQPTDRQYPHYHAIISVLSFNQHSGQPARGNKGML